MFSREINDDDDDVWLVPLLLRPPLLDHLNESIFTPQLCFDGRCNEIWVCGCDSDRPLWIKAVQQAQQRRIEFVKVRLNTLLPASNVISNGSRKGRIGLEIPACMSAVPYSKIL